MDFVVKQGSIIEEACDVLIVNLFEEVKDPTGATGAIDKALNGAISDIINDEDFKGSLGSIKVIRTLGKIPAVRVLLVGLGKREKLDRIAIMKAAGSAARECSSLRAKSVVSIVHGAGEGGLEVKDAAESTVFGTILGSYDFIQYKTKDAKENSIATFTIVEQDAGKIADIGKGKERAEIVGGAVCFARDLINEPSNVVTPAYLAGVAEDIAKEVGLKFAVKDRKAIEECGMGLLAAVSRGSAVEPRFIELRYDSPKAKKTIAIIGKGITFDTGGYSLKPSYGMYGMKDDMSGAAAVLATMRTIGAMKPDVNVLGLIPATENCIGGKAIHPGDVVKSLDGKYVEINNTDCEGRLVISDAVAYARQHDVDEIVDLATLTGACVTAIGRSYSGVIGTGDALIENLISSGKEAADQLWQLPLCEEYGEELKNTCADIKNMGKWEGGPIVGAMFIRDFVGDVPWAHIDLSAASIESDTPLSRKGATGAGVGTLVNYLLGH